jgi:hypothetical protein
VSQRRVNWRERKAKTDKTKLNTATCSSSAQNQLFLKKESHLALWEHACKH